MTIREAACISCNNCVEQVKAGRGVSCKPLVESPENNFFPQMTEIIPASPPHPPGTDYRISIGLEQHVAGFSPVIRIEMESKGKMLGPALSFSLDSDDYQKVNSAVAKLIEKQSEDHSK